MTLTTFRPYRKTDLETLTRIDRECFEPGIAYTRAQLHFYIERPGAVSFVAEAVGEIIGFVVGIVDRNSVAHVVTLDVVESWRGRGVGRKLIEAVHVAFVSQSAIGIVLEVAVSNERAIGFYERLNYRKFDRLADYYGLGKDAWEMILPLDPEPPGR